VKILLAYGADPNHATLAGAETGSFMRDCRTKGETPLSWASWHLRPGVVLHLLCYGDFHIHPERRKKKTCEPASGSMDAELGGTPHV
jgi:hypothetical protein